MKKIVPCLFFSFLLLLSAKKAVEGSNPAISFFMVSISCLFRKEQSWGD